MNIPLSADVKEGRRMATLFGSLFDRLEGGAGTIAYYTEVISARILHHRGVVVQSAGSVVLAEFVDAADAVNCAMDVQERFAHYNKLHLDTGTIEAKIGIHFGEMLFSEGKLGGVGVETTSALLSIVPVNKIYITREVFARVRKLLPLQLENVGKKNIGSLPEPQEILSVGWEAVTGNLEASLKKLREDDLQRATSLSSKLGFEASKRALPIVFFLLLIFLIILTKILKWP
jgi:class 3 adenylate cyclase